MAGGRLSRSSSRSTTGRRRWLSLQSLERLALFASTSSPLSFRTLRRKQPHSRRGAPISTGTMYEEHIDRLYDEMPRLRRMFGRQLVFTCAAFNCPPGHVREEENTLADGRFAVGLTSCKGYIYLRRLQLLHPLRFPCPPGACAAFTAANLSESTR